MLRRQEAVENLQGVKPSPGNANEPCDLYLSRERTATDVTNSSASSSVSTSIGGNKGTNTSIHLDSDPAKTEEQLSHGQVLTDPGAPVLPEGTCNINHDLILRVGDIIQSCHGSRYTVRGLLGSGVFGQVARCWDHQLQQEVAVKVCRRSMLYQVHAQWEVQVLSRLQTFRMHENVGNHLQLSPSPIVSYHSDFDFHGHKCIVMEILGDTLYDRIRQSGFQGLPLEIVRKVAKQVLSALVLLSQFGLIHSDIKPENICFKGHMNDKDTVIEQDPWQCKVIDFGSAVMREGCLYSYIQTRHYRAPEIVLGCPYDSAIDIWSLGCTLGELFLGVPLFPGVDGHDQIAKICRVCGLPPSWLILAGSESRHFFEHIALSSETNYSSSSFKLRDRTAYCDYVQSSKKAGDSAATKLADDLNRLETSGKQSRFWLPKNDLLQCIMMHDHRKGVGLPSTPAIIVEESTVDRESGEVEGTQKIDETQWNEMKARAEFADFLSCMLTMNPCERISPIQAMQHPFISRDKHTKSLDNTESTSKLPRESQKPTSTSTVGGIHGPFSVDKVHGVMRKLRHWKGSDIMKEREAYNYYRACVARRPQMHSMNVRDRTASAAGDIAHIRKAYNQMHNAPAGWRLNYGVSHMPSQSIRMRQHSDEYRLDQQLSGNTRGRRSSTLDANAPEFSPNLTVQTNFATDVSFSSETSMDPTRTQQSMLRPEVAISPYGGGNSHRAPVSDVSESISFAHAYPAGIMNDNFAESRIGFRSQSFTQGSFNSAFVISGAPSQHPSKYIGGYSSPLSPPANLGALYGADNNRRMSSTSFCTQFDIDEDACSTSPHESPMSRRLSGTHRKSKLSAHQRVIERARGPIPSTGSIESIASRISASELWASPRSGSESMGLATQAESRAVRRCTSYNFSSQVTTTTSPSNRPRGKSMGSMQHESNPTKYSDISLDSLMEKAQPAPPPRPR